jgi:hypothetical protein
VPFDVGYIDFDSPRQYREMWFGGGFKPIATPRVSLAAEGFLLKPYGEHAGGALYFQPFFLGTARVSANVLVESSYFAYVPLNDAGHAQHLLERAKIERDFPRFKIGAGYGAYKPPGIGTPWQHRPFVTATLKAAPVGNIEIWLQRLSDNEVTIQIRYAKVFVH